LFDLGTHKREDHVCSSSLTGCHGLAATYKFRIRSEISDRFYAVNCASRAAQSLLAGCRFVEQSISISAAPSFGILSKIKEKKVKSCERNFY